MIWLWIAVVVLATIAEAFYDRLIFVWFIPAAIVAAVLDILEIPEYLQAVACLIIAALGIVLSRLFLVRFVPRSQERRTNLQARIGEKCVVTEKIDNIAGCGQVRVLTEIWSARGVNVDDSFEVGEVLDVIAIEGVKLICKRPEPAKKSVKKDSKKPAKKNAKKCVIKNGFKSIINGVKKLIGKMAQKSAKKKEKIVKEIEDGNDEHAS